jgi:hypothetical protein
LTREFVKRAGVAGGAICAVIAVSVVLLIGGSGDKRSADRSAGVARTVTPAPQPPGVLPSRPPSHRRELAADIDRAQQIIDDRSSTDRALASAGLFEQLATGALERETPQARRAALAMLGRRGAAGMRTNLEASAELSRLGTPQNRLPHWKIVQPPPAPTLLGYLRTAQSQFGVRWEYLAAIEFIETDFGRVRGLSSAGAQGPMQFLPATWARYGRGNIDDPRDAILGAARYLVANGAPQDMADALYHYNNSTHYVRAVEAYATRMLSDRRAYDGYYYWQVLYARARGPVILPVGYPKARPVPVRYPRER